MSKGLIVTLCFVLLVSVTAATQFKVGGSGDWKVPESGAKSYNQWAEANRFKMGDNIAFTYPANQDSVLLVDSNAYNSCDATSPIDRFTDGNTIFTFARSGSFYFISGKQDNCKNGEKLHIVVLANRNNSTGLAPSPSLSPPTGAPPAEAPPAEAPSASSPPPPPSGEGEITPASSTPPPPNAASFPMISLVGTLGLAFVPFLNILV
ncbi:hypothetical protein LUZ61_002627 [Rhynchospora tenuis]|uniref:Phytocyanin domain-containing protein n=1 Tax=Rhynchospora tenuis TaxID=198213 RepID=A0AAD6ERW8_9POAL|nr:hypothetical protein LUZ61_002627 [Rhynchospora tenuis]